MGTIVLLKAAAVEDKDSFEVNLTKENYKVLTIKTIEFKFKNLAILKESLDNANKYAGIIFTSPRCVEAVHKSLNCEPLNILWNSKQNYGVGPKTVKCASDILKLKCCGSEAGNAANLAEIILNNSKEENLPFLYPKGSVATDNLKTKLGSDNTHDIVVYDTITSTTIGTDLIKITNNFTIPIDYVMFFSPSGVKATIPYLNQLLSDKVKVIAIGPTTEAALIEVGIKVDVKPNAPTVEALIETLKLHNN